MSNGKRAVQVRTLHGQFTFAVQRLRCAQGEETRFTEAGELTSSGVRALCLYFANRLPFGEVAGLVERIAGARLLSEDAVWRLERRCCVAS